MKVVGGRHFCRLLEKKGWKLKRISGSHHIYVKAGLIERVSVPVHGNTSLKMGLQRHLMKIANISAAEL